MKHPATDIGSIWSLGSGSASCRGKRRRRYRDQLSRYVKTVKLLSMPLARSPQAASPIVPSSRFAACFPGDGQPASRELPRLVRSHDTETLADNYGPKRGEFESVEKVKYARPPAPVTQKRRRFVSQLREVRQPTKACLCKRQVFDASHDAGAVTSHR